MEISLEAIVSPKLGLVSHVVLVMWVAHLCYVCPWRILCRVREPYEKPRALLPRCGLQIQSVVKAGTSPR